MTAHAAYEELVPLYAVGELDAEDTHRLLEHLRAGCAPCSERLGDYDHVLAQLHEHGPVVEPSAALHDRLMSRAAQSRGKAARTPSGDEAAYAPSTQNFDRFVGRDEELTLMAACLERLARGDGSIVAIEGEAGLGKTALVRALRARAGSAEIELLEGRAAPDGKTLSCHPVIELFESWLHLHADERDAGDVTRLAAAVAEVMDDESGTVTACVARMMGFPPTAIDSGAFEGIEGEALERLTQQSVRRLLQAIASRRPLLLVFEDIHWADGSSVRMIEGLLPLVESAPVMIVLAFRPGYAATAERLCSIARSEHALRLHDVRLAPLTDLQARALTRAILGTAEYPESIADLVKTRANGHPLYIEEVLNALSDTGALVWNGSRLIHAAPANSPLESAIREPIERFILTRVSQLDEATTRVLEFAAVAGRHCRRKILDIGLENHGGIDMDDALSRLQERRLLEGVKRRTTSSVRRRTLVAEEGYEFRHGLIQEVVYESIPSDERPALHLACAQAIERVASDRLHDFYGALAYHYTRARSLDKATKYLLAAGDQAAESAASTEALHLFREAHRCYREVHPDGGDAKLVALMEQNIATALLNTGKLSECIDHYNEALRLHGHWVPRSRLGLYCRLAMDLPVVLTRLYSGSIGHTAVQADEQVSSVSNILHNRSKAQNIVDAERNFFDNMAAIRYGAHAKFAASDHAAGFLAASGAVFTWIGLSFDVSRRFLQVASRIVDAGPPVDQFLYEAMSFTYRFHRGEWGREHDIAPELLERGLRHGALWDADVYLGLCCERNIRQGNYDDALSQIDALRRLRTEWGYEFARSNELAQTAFLLIEQRRLPEAHEAVARYYDSRQEETLHLLALGMRAKVEVLSDDLQSATDTLRAAEDLLRRGSVTPPFFMSAYWAARLRLAVRHLENGRDVGDGRSIARQALRVTSRIANVRAEVLGLTARLHSLLGDGRRAERYWNRAVHEGRALGVLPELARIYGDIAVDLLHRKKGAASAQHAGLDASQWSAKSRELFEALGAQAELDQLELLERSGPRRRVA